MRRQECFTHSSDWEVGRACGPHLQTKQTKDLRESVYAPQFEGG